MLNVGFVVKFKNNSTDTCPTNLTKCCNNVQQKAYVNLRVTGTQHTVDITVTILDTQTII